MRLAVNQPTQPPMFPQAFRERAYNVSVPARATAPTTNRGMGDDYCGSGFTLTNGICQQTSGFDPTGSAITGTFAGIQAALASGSALQGGIVGGLTAAAMIPGPQQPFIAAAASLAQPIMALFRGCGETCIQATEIANQAGAMLTKVKDDYFAQPVRTQSSQYAALQLWDAIAAEMRKMCGNPALGAAGQRCISERLVRGGTAPWCDKPGKIGCDWVTTLRDPIANDTGVQPDTIQPGSNGGGLSMNAGGFPMPLLLGAGALAIAFVMAGDQ